MHRQDTTEQKSRDTCLFVAGNRSNCIYVKQNTTRKTRQARWKAFFGSLKTFHSIRSQDPRCLELGEDAYQSTDISESIHPAIKELISNATLTIAYCILNWMRICLHVYPDWYSRFWDGYTDFDDYLDKLPKYSCIDIPVLTFEMRQLSSAPPCIVSVQQ